MNIFERVINSLGWNATNLQIQQEEISDVLAMPEDEALSYSIAYMQRLYVCALPYRQMDEDNKWTVYWFYKHRAFRNELVKHTKEFDYAFYDNWCSTLFYPDEFKVQP